MQGVRIAAGGLLVVGIGVSVKPSDDVDDAYAKLGNESFPVKMEDTHTTIVPDGLEVDANGHIFYNGVSLVQGLAIGSTLLTLTFLSIQFVFSVIKFRRDMKNDKNKKR